MRKFESSIDIAAAPETIWALLTDVDGYPAWNSTIHVIDGEIAAGTRLAVYSKATPGRGFPVTVTTFEPPRQMVWTGVMPLGMFKGIRKFHLTPTASGSIRFEMSEVFTGPLQPLITRLMPDLQPDFDRFAADLKVAAEARS